ncbi:MAG: dTMP kinase [Ignavibacteriae bacterium]|nr:dTMP kinase [Ignavibacteriota bacterium]
MFISLEGIDYSGKTTQANLLVDRLKELGKDVVLIREPGGTAVSEKIREILLDRKHLEISQRAELLLFSAARTQVVSEVIQPALQKGRIVICDRFVDSTTAYQGYGRGLDLSEVKTINRIATFGITPDLSFLVDVEVQEISRRQQLAGLTSDRMELGGNDFYSKVRNGYLAIAKEEPRRFVVINGMQSSDEIHKEIYNIVQQRLLM